jgi:hypothetical protein
MGSDRLQAREEEGQYATIESERQAAGQEKDRQAAGQEEDASQKVAWTSCGSER